MHSGILLLGASLLLAGCLGGESAPLVRGSSSAADADAAPLSGNRTAETLVNTTAGWSGAVPAYAQACTPQTECRGLGPMPNSVNDLTGLAGTVRGLAASLTWSPSSPRTTELAFGVLLWDPDCADCNATLEAEVSGASPLSLAIPDANAPVGRQTLRFYVWSPSTWLQSAGGWLGAQPTDQAFTVEGAVTTVVAAE